MRLTKLEIKGFKSFADKTVIHFRDNITGIVGPNGCGKSNVVDAIRWVLGEQKTSQLRLEKMDNVLFNGCKTRKATNLAEVSLSFDNTRNILPTEYSEVTITRKLFRSGESEYRINDVSCRLKDIQNLFIDSGIGSDSYAIIELGMVDEILQNKENARRKLFEQASSISKYKIRKKESILKLKQTEENLERLQDLLAEIESNIKQLEIQARRAERYNQIKDEYKAITLDILKIQVDRYKNNYNQINSKKIQEQSTKDDLDREYTLKSNALEQDKLILLQKEQALTEIQKKFNELIGGLGQTENKRNLLKEQISNYEHRNLELKSQNEKLQIEKQSLIQQLNEISVELAKHNLKLSETEPIVNAKKAEMEAISSEFDKNKDLLENDKKIFTQIQKEVFELDKLISIQTAKLEQIQKQKSDQEASIAQLRQKNIENLNEYTAAQKLHIETEKLYHELETYENSLATQINSIENQSNEIKNNISLLHRKLDSKRNEYSLLKSMIDNLEGYPESTKHLKRNLKSYHDKAVLSDLISCDDTYKASIEQLLAGIGNYFVVHHEHEAIEAIQSLKQSQVGKAGFWVMQWIERLPMPSIQILPGLTSALEVIKIEPEYHKLLVHLFYQTYFCHEYDPSTHNTSQLPIRIVELSSGNIIESHSLYGGAKSLFDGAQVGRKKNANILKSEIETLEKELQTLDKEWLKKQENISSLRAQSKREQYLNLEKELKNALDKFNQIAYVCDQNAINIAELEKQIDQKTIDIQSLETQIDYAKAQYQIKNNEFEKFKAQNESQSKTYEVYLEKYNQCKTELMSIQSEFISLQNIIKQCEVQKSFFENKINQLEEQMKENDRKWTENQSLEKEKIAELSQIETNIAQNYSEKDQFNAALDAAEKQYYEQRGAIIDTEKELKELESKRARIHEIILGYDTHIQEMRLELQSVKERLDIEFSIALDDFINRDLTVNNDYDTLIQKQNHIRKRLDTYGEVNPMAIESYREVKERYDFLVNQKNDIIQSKNNILNTIKEIDETARIKFLESFEAVRQNFINTFRILFTQDDNCDLILTDPSQPTESDIEIIAQPKGKKPLTINQLSGGEKTLTATALLFSLYLLKPAPFCIFDEIDAPLDDTNIAKFNKIIDEFSKNSQFIIVTHNKQTMASVEVLYGVTMIEQGVSKLVPVDFRSL